MRIDHLVLNVDQEYQKQSEKVTLINEVGFPYDPKKGKGTKGFKVSNLWIGRQYFEMVNILEKDGGGWKKEWVELFNKGYKGCVCVMIETDNINEIERKAAEWNLKNVKQERICYKIFGFFKMNCPWVNLYLPSFDNMPFQIGFQQYDDPNYLSKVEKRMQPNSKQNNINELSKIAIHGQWSRQDFEMLDFVFSDYITEKTETELKIQFSNNQSIEFILADELSFSVYTESENNSTGEFVQIENIRLYDNKR